MRACVRAYVRACVRACMCVGGGGKFVIDFKELGTVYRFSFIVQKTLWDPKTTSCCINFKNTLGRHVPPNRYINICVCVCLCLCRVCVYAMAEPMLVCFSITVKHACTLCP